MPRTSASHGSLARRLSRPRSNARSVKTLALSNDYVYKKSDIIMPLLNLPGWGDLAQCDVANL